MVLISNASAEINWNTESKEIYRERSHYRDVMVVEKDGVRCMTFGRYARWHQTCIFINDPRKLSLDYTKVLLASLYLNPDPKNVLIIGVGGGIIPSVLQTLFPKINIDVVEIDPAVIKVALQYFNFKPGENTQLFTGDGRYFVKKALAKKKKYDLVFLDAFDENYIPEHLATVEFLQEVKQLLTTSGVIAANTLSSNRLYDSESVTYAAALGDFLAIKDANRVIFYRKSGLPSATELHKNASLVEDGLNLFAINKSQLLPRFSSKKDWNNKARILTDQFSPVNLIN